MAINNAINQYPIVDALLGTWTPGAGTITSADSILTALQKISGSSVALSENNVWTGTNTFGNTVTFSTLTASTVPYLDVSKNLVSSAVTPTELGYISGVTSAIQTQLNAKAPLASPTFTGTVTIPTPFTLGAVSVTTTGTQLNYLASATGTTGTGNLVFSSSPTFTGSAVFNQIDANTLHAVGSGGLLIESNSGTDVALFGAGGGAGVTFYGGLNVAGSFAFTGTGANALTTNSSDGSDDKAIVLAGGGAYGVTRGSGVAVIGNEYASIGGDLELIAGDSAISGAIKFYVGDGGGGALLAGKIERSTKLTTFYGGLTTVGALYAGSGAFTDRIQVSGNISFPGAASGNGYIYHANDLGLVIYGEGTSLDLLFANKSGGTVMSVTTNTQNVDFAGAVNVVSNVTIGGQATATSVGLEIGNTAGGTPFIDFKSSAIDYDVRIINGASNVLSFLGGSGGYFFDATVNSIYSIVATTATATLTTITQGITIAGNLVNSAYLSDGYTAGLTWSSTDDNASKPKAGIFSRTTAGGSYLYLGTSASYVTGITNLVSITPTGGIDCAAITATSLVATSPVTSGTALQVTASSLTSGNGIYVYSNSSSASQFILLNLTSANASATGMIPLAIANAASVSTNYKIMMFLGGVFIWKSAGVTPNGNLTGTAGDICLGADSGKAYYCVSGTSWTAM